MANNPAFCGICDFQNVSNPSHVWCSECNEGLCSKCQIHHNASKGTRNHRTVPISEYQKLPPSILEISQYCCKHNEHFQTFCKKHDCPCCRKCVIENHNKCEDLATIDEVITNVKTSNAFLEIQKMLSDIAENIEKILNDRRKNLSTLQEQKISIEKTIFQLRTEINQHLDKIQEELIKKLLATEEAESTRIKTALDILEKKGVEIQESQSTIRNVQQYASDLQTFLAMKEIETNVIEQMKFVEAALQNGSIQERNILFNIDLTVTDFTKLFKTFGEICVDATPTKLNLCSQKEKQAQMMVSTPQIKSINSLKLTKEISIDCTVVCHNILFRGVNACSLLPGDKMAFSVELGNLFLPRYKVFVLDNNGSLHHEIKTVGNVMDITYIEISKTLAITGYVTEERIRENTISLVNANLSVLKKTIPIQSACSGVTSIDNSLIFCAGLSGIKKMDLNDETIRDIIKVKLPSEAYVSANKDCIYYTNKKTHTVTCCDMQGTQKWEFKDESVLRCPLGISVDNNGNVFVVGYDSTNLLVISADGQHHRELLTRSNGLNRPRWLDIDRSSNTLLLANERNALLFKID